MIPVAYGLRADAGRSGEATTPGPDATGRVRLRDPGFNVIEEGAPTLDATAPHVVAYACQGNNVGEAGTLRGGNGGLTGGVPFVAFSNRGIDVGASAERLRAGSHGALPMVAFSCKDSGADAGDQAPTLRAMEYDGSHANGGGQVAVALTPVCPGGDTSKSYWKPSDIANTLSAGQYPWQGTRIAYPSTMAVRRLTPVECARLQGFPDDYLSQVPYRGKPAADGPMYRALGNSMAVPCMRWIGERIQMVEEVAS